MLNKYLILSLASLSIEIHAMDGIVRIAWEQTNPVSYATHADSGIDECLQWKLTMQQMYGKAAGATDAPDFCEDMRRRTSHFMKIINQPSSEQSEQKHQ